MNGEVVVHVDKAYIYVQRPEDVGLVLGVTESSVDEVAVPTSDFLERFQEIGTGPEEYASVPVSYTHLTLPTICSV